MPVIMPDEWYGNSPVRVRISRRLGILQVWTIVDPRKALCSELLDRDGEITKVTKTEHLQG